MNPLDLSSNNKKRQRRSKQKCSNKIEKGIDFVTVKFSKELVLNVLSFLPLKDLITCAAVSKHWYRMANDEMLWRPLFFQRFRDPLILEDRRTRYNYNRKASVTRYGGSWKMKYRIHHNWVLGNCHINDIENVFKQNTNSAQSHHLQFLHDLVFVVHSNSSTIDVWKYIEDDSLLIYTLKTIENTSSDIHITFFKLIQGSTVNHLVAGYSNGGFTLWELNGTSSLDINLNEISSYTPRTSTGKVVSIGMDFPMIIMCNEDMQLSIFHVDSVFSLRLIHQLQSLTIDTPIAIDIQRFHPKNKTKLNNQNPNLWKATLCFILHGGNSYILSSTIGVQEFLLSSNALLSSKQGFAVEHEPAYSSSNLVYASMSEEITNIVYSPPHLITAHANNTMKQYKVKLSENKLAVSFKRMLYGHTFKVDALAIDAPRRMLISGDRSGIKIWDLSKGSECQVTLHNHANQSHMNELPSFTLQSIGFDEDKIVAIANTEKKSLVRLWSFHSMK